MCSSILPTYNRVKISFNRGKGSYLISKNGKKYIINGQKIFCTNAGVANIIIFTAKIIENIITV